MRRIAMTLATMLLCTATVAAQTGDVVLATVVVRAKGGGDGWRGTGVTVAETGNVYLVATAGHVASGAEQVTVWPIQHERAYPADIVKNYGDYPSKDFALVAFAADKPVPVVPLSDVAPQPGLPVWSCGFSRHTWPKIVTRRGSVTRMLDSLGAELSYPIDQGESGSPLFSDRGVVGILGYSSNGNAYATSLQQIWDAIEQCGWSEACYRTRRYCPPGQDCNRNNQHRPGGVINTPTIRDITRPQRPGPILSGVPTWFWPTVAGVLSLGVVVIVLSYIKGGVKRVRRHFRAALDEPL